MVDPLSAVSLTVTVGATFIKMFEAAWRSRHERQERQDLNPVRSSRVRLPSGESSATSKVFDKSKVSNSVQSPRDADPVPTARFSAGQRLLLCFAALLIIALIPTLIYYWAAIIANTEVLMFAMWLFFTMVTGMFAQVIVDNYQAGHPMFDIKAPDLLVPLFFSLIVYYSIWSVAASAPRGLFPFYAAFLNGYFWRHVVSQAKPSITAQTMQVPASPPPTVEKAQRSRQR